MNVNFAPSPFFLKGWDAVSEWMNGPQNLKWSCQPPGLPNSVSDSFSGKYADLKDNGPASEHAQSLPRGGEQNLGITEAASLH